MVKQTFSECLLFIGLRSRMNFHEVKKTTVFRQDSINFIGL